MAVTNTSLNNLVDSDSWGAPSTPSATPLISKHSSTAVRDDWDDDEADALEVDDPQKLWEEANARAPMPQVVIAGSSTSSTAALSPPPAALQPVMRILKRPSASSSSPSSPSPSGSAIANDSIASNSYAEREARYQAARERIFGEARLAAPSPPDGLPSASEGTSGASAPHRTHAPTSVRVSREPKGPPAGQRTTRSPEAAADGSLENEERGFSSRRVSIFSMLSDGRLVLAVAASFIVDPSHLYFNAREPTVSMTVISLDSTMDTTHGARGVLFDLGDRALLAQVGHWKPGLRGVGMRIQIHTLVVIDCYANPRDRVWRVAVKRVIASASGAPTSLPSTTMYDNEDTQDDVLSAYFDKSASVVRHSFGRFEQGLVRPTARYVVESFARYPLRSTFLATYATLSALPVLSFLGFSIFIFSSSIFFALSAAILTALSVVLFLGFWVACTLVLLLFLSIPIAVGVFITYLLLRFAFIARKEGSVRSALSPWAQETKGLVKRGKHGEQPNGDAHAESEAETLVIGSVVLEQASPAEKDADVDTLWKKETIDAQ
ncbi:hypothetical protein BN946_scf184395.g3 [Trametes cinnabarina]|uniref:SUZ domain-containing protein n=1 Tax=Pycnoporus cinnabarinus TaxID=5643 RepID=A0A060SQU1_PYCCI|nr:hypothetical protein BN946_scf184395.g3 [Trametes cinnabarina]